jgi:HPt (histidine-containing phosphotransfer) domain-containing protein
MTAAAMKGDRERCLEAGMDGYIAKPMDPDHLYRTLMEFAGKSASSEAESGLGEAPQEAAEELAAQGHGSSGGTPAEARGVLDLDAARQRLPGGSQLLKEALQILLDECPKLLREIRDGLAQRDATRVRRTAHTLKGSADVFAGKRVVAAAQQMENMGRDGRLDDAQEVVGELEEEVERLCAAARAAIASCEA